MPWASSIGEAHVAASGGDVAPAHSGAGVAMRALLIFVISLHALHELFIVGRSRS